MKRRLLALFLAISMIFVFTACKGGTEEYSEYSVYEEVIVSGDDGNATETPSGEGQGNTSTVTPNPPADRGEAKKINTYDGKKLANTMTIYESNTRMDKGLDFGGKTFTMAITAEEPQYHTGAFKRMIAAFQKKYNCKIVTKELVFNNYNQQITQAMSAGNPYDICFQHGSMYPAAPIANLYADLTEYVTTADFATEGSKSGIDVVKSSYYVWDGKLSGVSNYKDQYPHVIYYNKVLFEENDLEDPLELYNQGKWTWNKIKSMGQKVTDSASGVYFLSDEFQYLRTILVYGVPYITVKDGKPVNNLSSQGCVNGLNLIRSLYVGSSAIARKPDNGTDKYQDFLNGSVFMTSEESAKFPILAESAKSSTALGKNKNNIGIVPFPLDASNTDKAYPCGRMFATCAGNGSKDPRAAVAWSLFVSEYTDAVKDATDMSDAQKELCNKLVTGNTVFFHGAYSTSSISTTNIGYEIGEKVYAGGDISQIVSSYSAQIDACINATLKK